MEAVHKTPSAIVLLYVNCFVLVINYASVETNAVIIDILDNSLISEFRK